MSRGRRKRDGDEEKELRDFLYDVESSAKRILKDASQKKVREAMRARASSSSPRKSKRALESSSSSSAAVMQIPFLDQGGKKTSSSSLLPALQNTSVSAQYSASASSSSAAAILERVKKKLAESPLVWTTEGVERQKSSHCLRSKPRFSRRELEESQRQKPQLVQIGGDARSISGHFAPGTIPLRAEHDAPRTMSISAWLNPEKKLAIEQGLSTRGLAKALTINNELQGPSNWSFVDLRLKYRDEKERLKVWQASEEKSEEAERLRIEQDVFIPNIQVSEHPVLVDFKSCLREENNASAKRARERAHIKIFANNFEAIWKSNRPESVEEEELRGVTDRRSSVAHEEDEPQVQSVSSSRALRNASKGSIVAKGVEDAKKAFRRSSIETFSKKHKKECQRFTKQTDKKEDIQDVLFELRFRLSAFGLLETFDDQSGDDDEHIAHVRIAQGEDGFGFTAEVFPSRTLFFARASQIFWNRCKETFQKIHHNLQERRACVRKENAKILHERLERIRFRQKNEFDAKWWRIVAIAARFAGVSDTEDQFASLAGFTKERAGQCIEIFDKLSLKGEEKSGVIWKGARILSSGPKLVRMSFCTSENISVIVVRMQRLSCFGNEEESIALPLNVLKNWTVAEDVDAPPSELGWWRSESDWKSQVLNVLFPRIENPRFDIVWEGISSQTTLQDEKSNVKNEIEPESKTSERNVESFLPFLLNKLGLRECILREKRANQVFIVSEFAVKLCGRLPGSANFFGMQPPSSSFFGARMLAAVLFSREKDLSSTNSVTCVAFSALDSPLLGPTVFSLNPAQLTAEKSLEKLELPEHAPSCCAPQVMRGVNSVLDKLQPKTIVGLNSCARHSDLGLSDLQRKNVRRGILQVGHRRLQEDIDARNFRSWHLFAVEELLQPMFATRKVVFGITQSSLTLNAADVWPHRYTWHSDDDVRHALVRQRGREEFEYISHRGASVGSNVAQAFGSHLCVEKFVALERLSKTKLENEAYELESKIAQESKDRALLERLQAIRRDSEVAEAERERLEKELNEKRIERQRKLRGKTTKVGSHSEEWVKRKEHPSTRKLGRFGKWQAYLYLDENAREVIARAAIGAERYRLAQIASGSRPKTAKEMENEALGLACREGTLFYHHEVEDLYTWVQPVGWQGVATRPSEEIKPSDLEQTREEFALKHPFDDEEDYMSDHKADASAAIIAAKEVESSRRLRFVEENVKRWLDTIAFQMHGSGAFDLRGTFRDLDEDNSGLLQYEDFKVALANASIELPIQDQDIIIAHLDSNNTGLVGYISFIRWVLGTRPESMMAWMEKSMDMPDLGPNTWEQMRAGDKLLNVSGLHEEYMDRRTGQSYFYSIEQGEYSWIMPEAVAKKRAEERSAAELRQAQKAAALAAESAVRSAAHAEKASEKSVMEIISHLKQSKEFFNLIAEQLGVKPENLQEETATTGHVPRLEIRSPVSPGFNSGEESSRLSLSDDEVENASENESVSKGDNGITLMRELSTRWRILRATDLPESFVSRASRPNTQGADLFIYSKNLNQPSIVGVVDPADVSHLPFDDFPEIQSILIDDIMQNATEDENLNHEGDEILMGKTQDAFIAIKNLNFEKLLEALDFGVDVNSRDDKGNSLFIIACQQGSKKFAKFVLRRGGNINTQNLSGNTALHFCFQYGFKNLAEYLISKGADDSLLNKDGLTCYEGINRDVFENES